MFGWLKSYRRRRLLLRPFPPEWTSILARVVGPWDQLPEPARQRLCQCVRIIVAETYWEGCQGLTLTDEMRLAIAGNAALLLLGSENYYFDGVRTVLVFPQAFAREVRDGLLVTEGVYRSGEAYQSGTIVLSWADVQRDRRGRGHNVVVHEFAHHIDGLDGVMEGVPPLANRRELHRWKSIAAREFQQLRRLARQGRPSLLDQYGASSPAEFFAVASECFFERPVELQQQHPSLYELLAQVYQIDPCTWRISAEAISA